MPKVAPPPDKISAAATETKSRATKKLPTFRVGFGKQLESAPRKST
jgi:hypothetical protein